MSGLPEEHRDASWQLMTTKPTIVFSRTLAHVDRPGAELSAQEAVHEVRRLKRRAGPDLRTVGSLSLVQQLLRAGLADRLRLMVFPLVIGATGERRVFEHVGDFELQLQEQRLLDGRVVLLDYRPGGPPPYAG